MRLDGKELAKVRSYLRREIPELGFHILDKMEIGLLLSDSLPVFLQLKSPFPVPDSDPLLLAGRFGAETSRALLGSFIDGELPQLLVRTESWECYLDCHGEILTEHCAEDLDAIRAAIERLRKRCGSPS